MVKLQIDLSEEEDTIVEMYKAKSRLETKEQAVKMIIKNNKECNHKFKIADKIRNRTGSKLTIVQYCVNCGLVKRDNVSSLHNIIETDYSKK